MSATVASDPAGAPTISGPVGLVARIGRRVVAEVSGVLGGVGARTYFLEDVARAVGGMKLKSASGPLMDVFTKIHASKPKAQTAYRDIHDLVLTRSSAGKLARLLLSLSPTLGVPDAETRIHSSMTHEELAQRIGSSRETVSRLLSDLRKKRLIRLDGPTLVIRDRTALQALAV